MTQLINNYYAVPVLEDAADFQIKPFRSNDRNADFMKLIWWNDLGHSSMIDLPDGKQFDFLCTSTDITEEQAAEIVESAIGWDMEPPHQGDRIYKDYTIEKKWHYSALESFLSLLKSKNLTGRMAVMRRDQE